MSSRDTPDARKLKRLISAHTKAQVALSNSGSQDPEDRPKIEAEAKRAKKALNAHISSMTDDFWYL